MCRKWPREHEFAFKSICIMLGKSYSKSHDIGQFLSILQSDLILYGIDLNSLRPTIFQWNDTTRKKSRYGDEKTHLPVYFTADAESIIRDLNEVMDGITKFENKLKF